MISKLTVVVVVSKLRQQRVIVGNDEVLTVGSVYSALQGTRRREAR